MKKILGLALVVCTSVGLLSCSGSSKKDTETIITESEVIEGIHTAKNSLDYKGTYIGVLPCADCDSINVTIELGDSNYTKTDVYNKNGKTTNAEVKGTYAWEADGNNIILNGVTDAPNKYFVGENTLTQRDMSGNEITGDLASMYTLKKK
ncbi:copper resistance protein NlpE [Dysgonomonas sp. 216]|uniref:copper resistance protein NlpE n=1 Tax=Dysgonomonas sp. 216 TaxID=2302934 RepID=UPI0013CFB11F|nr:copper resistance protein NlpE [Dysgonomonas sp. 216]NDW18888.1 copper resistance protein NlpE [Dysgonomonas sp. 216]